jgi:hypothetical protein
MAARSARHLTLAFRIKLARSPTAGRPPSLNARTAAPATALMVTEPAPRTTPSAPRLIPPLVNVTNAIPALWSIRKASASPPSPAADTKTTSARTAPGPSSSKMEVAPFPVARLLPMRAARNATFPSSWTPRTCPASLRDARPTTLTAARSVLLPLSLILISHAKSRNA